MSIGQIYTSHVPSTLTLLTTGYTPIPSSTFFKACWVNNNVVKAQYKDTTSVRFVFGKDGKGIYNVNFVTAAQADVSNKNYHVAVFKNGVGIECLTAETRIGTTAANTQIVINGKMPIDGPNDYADIRISPESTGMQVTFTHFNFNLHRISTSNERWEGT